MQKKLYLSAAVFLVFCLFSAFTWPPENYEMPRTALDAATVEDSFSGLKISAGSIANTGFILLGIIVSVSLISTIFKRLFLSKIDGFRPSRSRFRSGLSQDVFSQRRERDLGGLGLRRRRGGGRR